MSLPFHTALTPAQQHSAGVSEPAPLAFANRVHHDELDALMHVNNVVYFVWFERLRIRFMELHNIGTIGDPMSPRIVVRSGNVHYIKELRRDDDYIVTTRCSQFRTTSLTLEQAIWVGGVKCATFSCVMVLLTHDGSARFPIPDAIKAKLVEVDGAAQSQ